MSIMCSTVKGDCVVILDLGVAKNGSPVYRVSWYNGKKWVAARYRCVDEAYTTYKMICRMV